MVDRFSLLADPPGATEPAETPAPTLTADPPSVAATLAQFGLGGDRPAVALCIGAEYGPAKRWPPAHFAALAQRLAAEGYAAWALGGPGDAAIGDQVAALAADVVNLAGRTSLPEAIDLIARGARRGQQRLRPDARRRRARAAGDRALRPDLAGLRTAAEPGRGDPGASNIPCSPCGERVCPLGHYKCLNDLAPERVLTAAEADAELGRLMAGARLPPARSRALSASMAHAPTPAMLLRADVRLFGDILGRVLRTEEGRGGVRGDRGRSARPRSPTTATARRARR